MRVATALLMHNGGDRLENIPAKRNSTICKEDIPRDTEMHAANHKEIQQRELRFAAMHGDDTDEELLAYIREIAGELGHMPNKTEVLGYQYIKKRLGPWPRVLERANLKKPPKNKKTMKQKRREVEKRRKEYRKLERQGANAAAQEEKKN